MTPETIELASKVVLGEVGWKKKVYQLVIIDCIAACNSTLEALKFSVSTNLGNAFNDDEYIEAFRELETNGTIICEQTTHKLSDETVVNMEEQKSLWDTLEYSAKNDFEAACNEIGVGKQDWATFRDEILSKDITALILQKEISDDVIENYKNICIQNDAYSPDLEQVNWITNRLINSPNDETQQFLQSYIQGYFNIQSLGVSNETLDSLKITAGKNYAPILLLDTNYLFSILNLHDNPANEIIKAITNISKIVSGNILFEYRVHPRTIDEFRNVVRYEMKMLEPIRFNAQIAKAIISQSCFSGFAKKYAERYIETSGKLSLSDYCDPFINDTSVMLSQHNINLHNSDEGQIKKFDVYLDDLSCELRNNEERPDNRKRGTRTIEHDLILWHLAKAARPMFVDQFLDSRIWVATIDYWFINFDKRKCENIPVCLDPSVILKMLQVWLPQDSIMTKNLLKIIRLPGLIKKENDKTDEIALKITSLLSRFSSSGSLTEETINKILLNRQIRNQIRNATSEDDAVKIIQDNILEYINQAEMSLEESERRTSEIEKEKDLIIDENRKMEEAKNALLQKVSELERQKEQSEKDSASKLELDRVHKRENLSSELNLKKNLHKTKTELLSSKNTLLIQKQNTRYEAGVDCDRTKDTLRNLDRSQNRIAILQSIMILLALFCIYEYFGTMVSIIILISLAVFSVALRKDFKVYMLIEFVYRINEKRFIPNMPDMDALEKHVITSATDVTEMKEKIKEMEQEIADIDKEIDRLERDISVLENP